jgi:hypothetical protein
VGRWAREQLEGPVAAQLRAYRIGPLADRPVNNARLIGALLYRTHLDWLDRWYQQHGSDVRRSVAELRTLMDGAVGDTAFERLGRAVGDSSAVAGGPAGDSVRARTAQ